MKKEHNGALLFALLILVTLIMLLTGCKTKQQTATAYENAKDSTTIETLQIKALDSLKINDTTSVKIEDNKVITSVSSGRTTEITLDSSAVTTLASILDGSAFLKVKEIKITENRDTIISKENKTTEKARKIEMAEISAFEKMAKDSIKVIEKIMAKEQTLKESKATGGFGWGVTVTVFILAFLIIGFLYLKYK